MKVTAFNGSPRKGGNTEKLLRMVLDELEVHGIETELIQVGGKALRGCTACGACRTNLDRKCVLPDDGMNGYIEKMIESDGILIGAPTYFSTLNAETKALIDRSGYVTRGCGNLLSRKIGAGVSAVRRAGSMNVLQSINNFFLVSDMIVSGSSYWALGMGRAPGDVESDQEGVSTMKRLGENMAWLLNKTVE